MKKTSQAFRVLALFAVATVLIDSAHGQSVNLPVRTYVSGTGDDANACGRLQPCRTFAGALTKTSAGGEINCIDQGGYGEVTINKSITIDCAGSYAGILHAGTTGVTVAAGPTDKIVLRNLAFNGAGQSQSSYGPRGIQFVSGRELHVDRATFENFSVAGIEVSKTAIGLLSVQRSTFVLGPVGIKIASSVPNVIAMISDSSFSGLTTGVDASSNSYVTVRNSWFSAISNNAIIASAGTATFYANDNVISNSAVGLNASVAGAKASAANNKIYGNSKATNVAASAVFLTAGDNKFDINPGSPATGALGSK